MLHRRGERGAAVAEMAIFMPLLILFTLGAFELGRGMWTKHTLSHIAREAARYASVRSTASDDPATADKVKAKAQELAVGINAALLNVTTTWKPANQAGGTVRVNVQYEFKPVLPLLPVKTIAMTSNSQLVIAY